MTAIDPDDHASGTDQSQGGATYDPSKKPPPFGRALKVFWGFEPGYVNLNHGAYGSTPLPVLRKCSELTAWAEGCPDRFHRIGYMPLHRESRRRVAEFIGAEHEEVVLVPNATHGINTVLRNFEWREGDVLIGSTTTYGAISRTIQALCDRSEPPCPTAHSIVYNFPTTHAEILSHFRTELKAIKALYPQTEFSIVPHDSSLCVERKEGKNRMVIVIDSMASTPGVLFPWKSMVKIAKEEGVWTVIDAAHSIGQENNLNIREAGPDFLITNCHKWLWAKRSVAVLYVPKRNQYIIKTSIPTSHAYVGPNDPNPPPPGETHFVEQHEWTGTIDQVPNLSIPAALDFRLWLGGETVINDYCHATAMKGGKRIAEVMGTDVMDKTGEFTCNMVNVRLPLPVESVKGEVYSSENLTLIDSTLKQKLLFEWHCYAAHYFHNGAWWCRCSAQVWTEMSDFEYVGNAFNHVCKEIRETILAGKTVENTWRGRL